jgi:hypothetical protein
MPGERLLQDSQRAFALNRDHQRKDLVVDLP